jgi:hypothetical protein
MSERETALDTEQPPPSAADALAIIQRQQAHTTAGLTPNLALLYGIWGVVWLIIGVGFYLLRSGTLLVPSWLPGTALAVLLVTASVFSWVLAARGGRGVRGASDTQGAMYGLSWLISMIGMGFVIWGLARLGLADDIQAVLHPAAFVLLAGVLYLAGGALWHDRLQYGLGGWIILVAVASVHAGLPANYLVLGFGGGGGLLAVAGLFLRRRSGAR